MTKATDEIDTIRACTRDYRDDLKAMDDDALTAEVIDAQGKLDDLESWLEALHAEEMRRDWLKRLQGEAA